MSDIFISYARSSEGQAVRVEEALREAGYGVWRDAELPAHRTYAEVIEERLKGAKAVVVLWSADAAKSQWVRAEADAARELGTLVQASIDGTVPPIPFNQIQCAGLKDWDGDTGAPGWRKLQGSVEALAGRGAEATQAAKPRRQKNSICVLPFVNMSGDPEQEYFSDGISEDITTDLSKVSALEVIARNTAFQFKGQSVDVTDVAQKIGVSHVLEGSVRKAGNRVRITAQLIDGSTGGHVWADRYDRDLDDIFAIQDEISKAIVDALKVRLLPKEKKAMENRGTDKVDAYNLYLMARQLWIGGAYANARNIETIVRICEQAVALDPGYAEAWALMALAQAELRFWLGMEVDALPAAERAVSINPDLPEPRCVKARYLEHEGRIAEANEQIESALQTDPESWEVNREAARLMFRQGRLKEAAQFFEKASDLMTADFHSSAMLQTCYSSLGPPEMLRQAAERCLTRSEAALRKHPGNGAALAAGALSLLALGEEARASDWVQRALLLDPDNPSTLYNLACAYCAYTDDQERALDILEVFFEKVLNSTTILKHIEVDPDIDSVRDHPRFKAMLAAAKERLEPKSNDAPTPAAS